MKSFYCSGKKLTMEETIQVYEWLRIDINIKNYLNPDLKLLSQKIKDELGIRVRPQTIERLIVMTNKFITSQPRSTPPIVNVIEALEYLYDELGEERHTGLRSARRLIS